MNSVSRMSSEASYGMSYPFVSIIIVNYNGLKYLGACLSSLQALDYPKDRYEVILVDNASTDGSVQFVREEFPHVRVIGMQKNFGFCVPNNVGAKEATGKYLAFLNNDTEVDRVWLSELVRGLSVDAKIKSVASKIMYCDQKNRINAAGGKLTVIGHGFYEGYGSWDAPEYNRPKFTGFGCGAAVLVERAFFLRIGGFDPAYFAGIEEHDLGWSIWLRGYKAYYQPSAKVYHWESGTFGRRASFNPIKVFYATRNRLFNMTKHVQRFGKGLFLCVVHDSLMACNFLLQKRVSGVRYLFLSYVAYLKNLRRVFRQRNAIQPYRQLDEHALVAQEVLAPFRELMRVYFKFFKISREPHYAEWESAGSDSI